MFDDPVPPAIQKLVCAGALLRCNLTVAVTPFTAPSAKVAPVAGSVSLTQAPVKCQMVA
jgi:hypothetical protein